MTKFLNISTDNTLGGNAPSDALVVSQKAIKEYVDNQAGGGGYHPDLFTWQWADHELNDVQWLRADTFSWQSGAVYQAAYQHLVDDIPTVPTITLEDGDVYVRYANGDVAGAHHPYCWKIGNYAAYTNSETPSIGDWTFANATSYLENARITATGTGMPSPETETIAGTTISYYVAADGHKIVLADQESKVAAIYAATGVAWYYILDTANQRFKLPRTKFGFTGIRTGVGKFVEAGLPNLTGNAYSNGNDFVGTTTTGVFSGTTHRNGYGIGTTNVPYGNFANPLNFNASLSNSIYGNSDTVQPKATEMYLYFYVGNFTQTALENTAGLNAELFNGKVDTGHQVIAFQAPTANNNYTWYRKYADGWVEQGGFTSAISDTGTVTLLIIMSDLSYQIQMTISALRPDGTVFTTDNNWLGNCWTSKTTTGFTVKLWDADSSSARSNGPFYWEVKGMAAN